MLAYLARRQILAKRGGEGRERSSGIDRLIEGDGSRDESMVSDNLIDQGRLKREAHTFFLSRSDIVSIHPLLVFWKVGSYAQISSEKIPTPNPTEETRLPLGGSVFTSPPISETSVSPHFFFKSNTDWVLIIPPF
jgi:hypothetical protein